MPHLEVGNIGFGSHGVIVGQRINHSIGLELADGSTNAAQSIESWPNLPNPTRCAPAVLEKAIPALI